MYHSCIPNNWYYYLLVFGFLQFICIVCGDEIHFITSTPSSSSNPSERQTFEADASHLGEILAHSLGISILTDSIANNQKGSEPFVRLNFSSSFNNALKNALDNLVNSPFKPIRNYWMIVFIGIESLDPKVLGSSILVTLNVTNPAIKLYDTWIAPIGKSHTKPLGDLIMERADPESFILFESSKRYLYDTIASSSLPQTKNIRALLGGREAFIEYMNSKDIMYENFTTKLYGSPDADIPQQLTYDLEEIPRLFDVLLKSDTPISYLYDDMVNKSSFNFIMFTSTAFHSLKGTSDYSKCKDYLSESSKFYKNVVNNLLFNAMKPKEQTLGIILFIDQIDALGYEGLYDHDNVYAMSDFDSDVPYCYASEKSCIRLTRHCSNRGKCVDQSFASDTVFPSYASNTSCWVCECIDTDWTGPACQFQDWSDSFLIILTSITILIIFVFGSLYALANHASDDNASGKQFATTSLGNSSIMNGNGFKED